MLSGTPTKSGRGADPLPFLERVASVLGPGLLWLVAFTIFLRHHDYGLLRTDSAMAALYVLLLGAIPGVVLALGPRIARAVVFGLVGVVFLDLQTTWLEEPLSAGFAFATLVGLGGLANAALGRGLAFVSAVMIAATLPLPPGAGWIRPPAERLSSPAASDDAPPAILHLVLDEHIASAAIPGEFDPGATLRRRIEAGYAARGFRVFSHAFSRHYTTGPSLSHALNLSAGRDSLAYYDPEAKRLTRNAWFRLLRTRGYGIRVVQSDYLDLCHPDDGDAIADCTTYALESIKAIEGSGLDRSDRTRALLGSFGQLSQWHQRLRRGYERAARERGGSVSEWPLRAGRLSTVSSARMLPRVEEAFARTKPGEITFAHLLLPHFPYAYDGACALRASPLEWRSYKGAGLRGLHNDAASRAERYPLYLAQLGCTQRWMEEMFDRLLARPSLRDAIIIVHGDHGPRLNLTTPVTPNAARLSDRDLLDAFATHFAVRTPGDPGGVDSRGASIDALLRVLANRGAIPEDDDWIGSPNIHLVGETREGSRSRPIPW